MNIQQAPNGLYDYGIQTESSDVRVHVCVIAQRVYIYRTAVCHDLVALRGHEQRGAKIDGQLSATGYLVPPENIPGCRSYLIPPDLITSANLRLTDSELRKGEKAAEIAKQMLRRGLMVVPLDVEDIPENTIQQVSGIDLHVRPVRLQVKCDYRGGERKHGGTGNLFIQTAERRVGYAA